MFCSLIVNALTNVNSWELFVRCYRKRFAWYLLITYTEFINVLYKSLTATIRICYDKIDMKNTHELIYKIYLM